MPQNTRILLIEDNKGDARLLREMLYEMHAESCLVDVAYRLSDGIALLAKRGFDAVLLDLSLPDAQGLDTLLKLQAEAEPVPIIVLSGLNDEAVAAEAVALGAQDYLIKGKVDGEIVMRTIRYAIERHRMGDELRKTAGELQLANQELVRVDHVRSNFLAMASHELRTPLTAIEGFTSTMLHRWEQLEDDEKVHFLEIIDDQSHRLSRLVEDLLTLSKVESGKLKIEHVNLDIALTVKQALRAMGAGDEVSVSCPDDLVIVADEDHVTQILINYVSNAQKYGAPPIEVEVSASKGWVEICVSDHGVGVPERFVSQLFHTFARASSDTSSTAGTGLGLSIVRGLAQAEGGSAWYEPNQPIGSRFKARLPQPVG